MRTRLQLLSGVLMVALVLPAAASAAVFVQKVLPLGGVSAKLMGAGLLVAAVSVATV